MKFLTTLCMAALASALFRMLVPENKLSKQISILIAGVFLLTGITAVSGVELDLDTEQYRAEIDGASSEIGGNVNKSLQEQVCREMSDKIYKLLNERGIFPKEIHIAANISGLYSISITQVELVFSSGEQAAANAAADILKAELSPEILIKTDVKE